MPTGYGAPEVNAAVERLLLLASSVRGGLEAAKPSGPGGEFCTPVCFEAHTWE